MLAKLFTFNPRQIFLLVLLAIALRMLFASFGNNFDVESYWIVGKAVAAGENVYAATTRYNYGPLWSGVLGLFYSASGSFAVFRLLIAGLLSIVDVGIFALISKQFGKAPALAFLFNPISIFITGYHSQFDNLAILMGLAAIALLPKSGQLNLRQPRSWLALGTLGLSLVTKHILFVFPLWLAYKQKGIAHKLAALLVPIAIFLTSFAPWWASGSQGILQNVFLYRSFNNAPFWYGLMPGIIGNNVPAIVLFIGSMVLLGLFWRKRDLSQLYVLYLGALVLCSSSVANQYLAICVPLIAVFWRNIWLQVYTLVSFIYLLADPVAGLGLISNTNSLFFRLVAYNVQAALLFLGMIEIFHPRLIKKFVQKFWQDAWKHINWQWRSVFMPRNLRD